MKNIPLPMSLSRSFTHFCAIQNDETILQILKREKQIILLKKKRESVLYKKRYSGYNLITFL